MTGLFCPTCGSDDLGVIDSRPNAKGVRRTRKCNGCGQRMRTIETIAAIARPGYAPHFVPVDDLTTDVDAIVADIAAMLPALIRRSLRIQREQADA